jgi:hypothetical protein
MTLRSIGLAKVSLECDSPIVTLSRESDSTEFVKQYKPKLGPLLTESRDIVEAFL